MTETKRGNRIEADADGENATLRHLEQVAWVLRTGRGRRIGFVPARELEPSLRHLLDDDDWT